MTADQLSAPGSSSYDSSTLVVGDGTWDSTDNTFLLPNLVGLNLATTQYNGMGNRFKDLKPYHTIIAAHAAIACVIFLLLIPIAILLARFSQSRRGLAIRAHIWIHILVVFLSTVVLVLGWFAVGPTRSLTNPHHAIGVALYTLIMVQFLGGALMRRLERRKDRDYIPVKVMLHHWFGRIIALLGFAQIPLGFALYGVAEGYFVMYALVMAFWIVLYFILSHRYQSERSIGSEYGGYRSERSYATSHHQSAVSRRNERKESHMLRDTALIGGALAAFAALKGCGRDERRKDDRVVDEEVVETTTTSRRPHHSRMESEMSIDEEKYPTTRPREDHTWRNRILGAGAGLAAFEGVRHFFGRKDERDEEGSIGGYSRPPLGNNSVVSHTDISRVRSGEVPFSPDSRRGRTTEMTTVDTIAESPTRVRPPRSFVTADHASVGSGPSQLPLPPTNNRVRTERRESFSSESSFISNESPVRRPRGGVSKGQGIAATLAGVTGIAYLREKAKQRRQRKEDRRSDELRRYDDDIAASERHARRRTSFDETIIDDEMRNDPALTGSDPALSRHRRPNISIPPLPASAGVAHSESSSYISHHATDRPGYPADDASLHIPTGPGPVSESRFNSNTSRVHFSDDVLPAAAAGTAAALAASALSDRRRDTRRPDPVAVKVRIHDDNRHVTLRRLNEAEASAERDRRRRRPRTESLSSDPDDREGYRRPAAPPVPVHTSPPVASPRPGSGVGYASRVGSHALGSPSAGYDTGTGTEMSQFDENRRRRRAERAAAQSQSVARGSRGEYD